MKNPNGYGCIKKLSGNRRRPYAFVITENGTRKVIDYFSTQVEALIFQTDYNKTHNKPRLTDNKMTFSELYHRWLPSHVAHTEPSKSTIDGYHSAYSHCKKLFDMDITKIKYKHVQTVIDDMQGLSYSSKKKVRSLISLLFTYANQMEYCSRSFSRLISIGKNKPVCPHHAFTTHKINRLWNHTDKKSVQIVLILIYTGMRNIELRYLKSTDVNRKQKFIRITKSKTESGIRIVPIHNRILPLIENLLQDETVYLLSDKPLSYAEFRAIWNHAMKLINGRHTPHDSRHTCATLLDAAEINDNARKLILGHSRGDVTNGIYTHKTLRQLRNAINKI